MCQGITCEIYLATLVPGSIAPTCLHYAVSQPERVHVGRLSPDIDPSGSSIAVRAYLSCAKKFHQRIASKNPPGRIPHRPL